MEDRVKKYKRQKFIVGLVGVLVGSIIYSFVSSSDSRASSFIWGVMSAIIAYSIHDLYHHFKYPKMKETKIILDNDERNILVKGRSAYITMNVALFSLIIPITVGILKDNQFLTIFSMGLYFFIFIVFNISKIYWNKKI